MPTIVAPPERTPLTGGLFSVLTFPATPGRWEMGVTFPGQTCGPLPVSAGPGCTPEGQDEPDGWPIPMDRDQPWGEIPEAFTVSGTYTCAPVGVTPDEAADYAAADLQRHEEATAERVLWEQIAEDAEAAETTGPRSLREAVGILEHIIGRDYGTQGVIHLPRWLAASVDTSQRGGRVVTEALGTPIVAGSGYGAPGEELSLYATPALVGYRSPVEIVGDPRDTFDRGTNTLQVLAQRTYLIGYDTCPPVSITVDLTL